jgi:3-oxoacyl-ACP reductase-like protein
MIHDWFHQHPNVRKRIMNSATNAAPGNQVALITGAARGIGAEVARRLARDGFSVAINYASS